MKTKLILLPHLGLGDAIICNGLVRTLATQYERIILPAKSSNLEVVIQMLSDLDNVGVYSVCGDEDARLATDNSEAAGERVLRLGGHRDKSFLKGDAHFDEEFYRQAKIPFGYRWSAFKLPLCSGFPDTNFQPPYAFVCDHCSQGKMTIDESQITRGLVTMRPTESKIFLWWIGSIYGATEIHCIDGAFCNLIESLDLPGKPMFFHKYARKHPDERLYPTLRKPWVILE